MLADVVSCANCMLYVQSHQPNRPLELPSILVNLLGIVISWMVQSKLALMKTFIAHLTTTLHETLKYIVDIILHQPAEEQRQAKVIATLVKWKQSEETRQSASLSKYWQIFPGAVSIPSDTPSTPSALHTRTNPRRYSSMGNYYHFFNSYIRPAFTKYGGHSEMLAGSGKIRMPNYSLVRGLGYKSQSQQEC